MLVLESTSKRDRDPKEVIEELVLSPALRLYLPRDEICTHNTTASGSLMGIIKPNAPLKRAALGGGKD